MSSVLSRWRRLIGVSAAVLLIAVAVWAWLERPDQPPIEALGVVSLVAAALAWAVRGEPASTSTQLELAAETLARMTASQWRAEAATRGLLDPRPLRIRWTPRLDIADHSENVGAVITGLSEDPTRLAAAFVRLPHRRLVIVGDAGSGKTTLALLLLLSLTEQPIPGHVPVLFSIASWDPLREHLLTWLTRRLNQDFVGLRAPAYGANAARDLVKAGQILPILDGLDEMPEPLRPHAMTAINRALSSSPMVLTCRTAEYETAVRKGDVITAAALIEAQPVRPDEAVSWLQSGIPPYRMASWKPIFDRLQTDVHGPLAQALTTPLSVWLVRTVFSGPDSNPAVLVDTSRFATPAAIENYLLDALIPALIIGNELPLNEMPPVTRRGPTDDACRDLAFVAAHLARMGTEDFAWWELHKTLPMVVPRLAIGVAVGLVVGVLAEIVSGWSAGLLIGIFAGAVSFFLSSSSAAPPGYASFRKRSWKRFSLRRFAEQLVGGLLGGVALGLFAEYRGGQVPGPLGYVVSNGAMRTFGAGLVVGLAGGVVLGAVELLRTPAETDTAASPSSTLSSDRRLTLVSGFVITVISGVIAGLLYGILVGLLFGLTAGLATALITGIGGAALGRKLTVRAWPMFVISVIVLHVKEGIPLRLMRFLEYAYDIGVMRRVGAVYQFRHDRLQHRLATTYEEERKARDARNSRFNAQLHR